MSEHISSVDASVFVVVPAYNEADVIRQAVHPLINAGYRVVVIDDGSTDNTWSIVGDLPVFSIRHPINLGQGASLQTGMTFALQQGAEIIVHFDADGQHKSEDVAPLIEPLCKGEADVVFGSRFLREADKQAVPRLKRIVLRCAVLANGILTGLWLSDAHNGFRAMTRCAARQIRLRENRYAHASEILQQVRTLGLRYVERPTSVVYSEYSKAKGQSIWNACNILFDLLLRRLFR